MSQLIVATVQLEHTSCCSSGVRSVAQYYSSDFRRDAAGVGTARSTRYRRGNTERARVGMRRGSQPAYPSHVDN